MKINTMEPKKITLSNTSSDIFFRALQNSYMNLKDIAHKVSILLYTPFESSFQSNRRSLTGSLGNMNSNFKKFNFNRFHFKPKKLLLAIVPILIVVVLITVIAQAFRSQPQVQNATTANAATQPYVKSSKPINKTFHFPLKDNNGKDVGTFTYEIQNAELRNQIVVKGQPATAVPGRTFLIINFQLKNDLPQGLEIRTRDYVRLSVNGDKNDLQAPDIYNDPVQLQAISVQYNRLGFAINESDKDLVLFVGAINGSKTQIPLKF